jgi:ParB family chromosome partitioning protein
MERKVLGRGLEALIPQRGEIKEREFVYLSIEKIRPSKFQPREEIEPQDLKELSQSIREKGLIQPIVVRKIGEDSYEVVAGNRRFYASKLLGIKELPTIIKALSDKDAYALALIENIQRKDLNPMEEALAFKRLNEEFGLKLDQIAQLVGKDKTSVANSLRLLKLPDEIQTALKKGAITKTQARTILGLEDQAAQKALFYRILKEGLAVREIEEKVRSVSRKRKRVSDPFVSDIEEKLKKSLGTKVKIYNKKNNSGKIVISYYNLNDLERITKRLI